MNKATYQYCCVSPRDLEELQYIVDNNQNITYPTFRKHVNTESFNEIKEDLGYTSQLKKDCNIALSNDWSVSFHKSKTPDGKSVYYICHSAIEYIFY